jgi:Rrf2 family protein
MHIPPRFLPQIMGDLSRAGLVEPHPGRSGGYRLVESAEGVSLLRVIEAVEGDPHRQVCVLRGTACGSDGECAVHSIFFSAEGALLDRLNSATLAGVVKSATQKSETQQLEAVAAK